MTLGLTSCSAEIIDQREAGENRIFDVLASGITKNAAVRSAKLEVQPLIPVRDLEVINTTLDKDLGVRKRYIVRISHNEDEY